MTTKTLIPVILVIVNFSACSEGGQIINAGARADLPTDGIYSLYAKQSCDQLPTALKFKDGQITTILFNKPTPMLSKPKLTRQPTSGNLQISYPISTKNMDKQVQSFNLSFEIHQIHKDKIDLANVITEVSYKNGYLDKRIDSAPQPWYKCNAGSKTR